MTVRENLLMGAFSRNPAEVDESLQRVFQMFPLLEERQKQLGGTLSGGQQQMLAIGRALMARPTLFMLDEPSLGLAPLLVNEVFSAIEDLKGSDVGILLVEQNARKALQIADRAYCLETGQIVLSGTGEELRNDERVNDVYLGGHRHRSQTGGRVGQGA
jgi:branched-chain amino acid transport system ATP-binding protein